MITAKVTPRHLMSSKPRTVGSGSKVVLKKSLKTRASLHFCQERLACRGPQPEAHYHCHECESYQCEACESVLHETAKFLFHDRVRLKPPAPELLCELECKTRNFADFHCDNCNKNLCTYCDAVVHSQVKNRTHLRVPFEPNSMIELNDAFSSLSDMASFFSAADDIHDVNRISLSHGSNSSIPDVASSAAIIDSSHLYYAGTPSSNPKVQSFLLVNNEEVLQVENENDFIQKLGSTTNASVKVVSIFGNTGEGKSYTLNHTFFNGDEVFHTSPSTTSATIGVWAAYDPTSNVVVIDTEGLLGASANQNKRTRLLLKVLAISDVVIYRTRAGRLHSDLFQFLGDASAAYVRHFVQELRSASERCNLGGPLSTLGPVAIIFHETQHTDYLQNHDDKTPEDQIKQRFHEQSYSVDAFSAIEYVGIQTIKPPTSFVKLQASVMKHLDNSSVRSPRQLSIIFYALKVLNEKFIGDIERAVPSMFPDQYFTCSATCLSCNSRCANSMNHAKDGVPHVSSAKCKYEHQYDNRIFTCKKCYEQGREIVVVPKTSASTDSTWLGLAIYAWSGYVLECSRCGIIYRSRQYWYGNRDPVETVVRTEIQHVWPGGNLVLQGTHNAAWKVIDSVSYLSNTVSSVSAKPTKMLTSWVADQVAPAYWVPNSQITNCHKCGKEFEATDSKHHCRACGRGFCEDCSTKSRTVPERGWGTSPVRVCDACYENADGETNPTTCLDSAGSPTPSEGTNGESQELMARKVTEVIQTTLGTLASAIDYPLELIKDSARPAYWIPDHEITACAVCRTQFSVKLAKHHCRSCGEGVCSGCSATTRPVPSRGWDTPVRVCDICNKKSSL